MATFGAYDQSHVTLRRVESGAYSNAHDALEADQLVTTLGQVQQQFYGAVEEGVYTFKSYIMRRFSVRFDTNSLPAGANIISAKIEIKLSLKDTAISNTWSMVVQNGQPTYPHYTVGVGDYYHGHYSGNGGSIHCDNLHTSGEIDDIVLNTTGISWINAGDYTKLILRLDHDIDSIDPAPDPPESTSGEWISEGVELQISYTRLWIVYEVALITTEAASGIIYKAAMGNGTTVAGENITERGFEVKVYVDFFGFPAEQFWNLIGFYDEGELVHHGYGQRTGYLIKRETWTGEFGTGAFEGVLGHATPFGNPGSVYFDALRECLPYTYRAYMIADAVTYYGEWVAFNTPCYPAGHLADDQLPIEDVIPILEPFLPVLDVYQPPINGIEGFDFPDFVFPDFTYPDFTYPDMDFPDFWFPNYQLPDFILPEIGWPDFNYPSFEPSLEGSWLGGFYYRKAYTKKDLDELRRKCRIFQDNSVEYALILRHNSSVLQQFLNDMTTYTGTVEYNTFKPVIPTQHLNKLARKRLNVKDFKGIINNFIRNSIDNAISVNHNFGLIEDGLLDPYGKNVGFISIAVKTRQVGEDNPSVERLKEVMDSLNRETALNYNTINHNLKVLKAMLIG